MRILLQATLPTAEFNAAVKDGTAGAKIRQILDDLKPEAVYFTEEDGYRGAILVVDLADPAQVPKLAEPWFLTFNAEVRLRVAMTPQDLERAGLAELGKKWG